MLRRLRLLLWPAGAVFGLTAEYSQFGWGDLRHWIPDLAVGWVFIACGLVALDRRRESRSGLLMAATGFSWFIGNFAHVRVGPIDWVASHAVYLYLGPLLHLLIAYPSGRLSSRLTRGAVAVGYVTAVITPIWRNEEATIVLTALLVAVSARVYVRTVSRFRRARLLALWASTAFSLVLGGYAGIRLVLSPAAVSGPFILAYQATLCVIAVGLLAGLLSAWWERSVVTDLVVELGEARSESLRDALARALGDPTLEVGYWLPDGGTFVDPEGHPVSLSGSGSERSVTKVERDGQPVAVLVHDPAVLDDPGLLEAVSTAARLGASNARLRADVQDRIDELRESRRRILEAGDEERQRLERRLHDGAERRLTALAEIVRQAGDRASNISPGTIGKIERAQRQLEGTLEELNELAGGLHPRSLSELGLERSLALLADRSPVPVELIVRATGLPPGVEAAVYFLASEALANVAKYASATHATISVEIRDQALWVEVIDDGVGGANVSRGTGMLGLADRVEALAGSFRVESRPGQGTRLVAEIPLQGDGP
jgi:signal transduction histidine kinase